MKKNPDRDSPNASKTIQEISRKVWAPNVLIKSSPSMNLIFKLDVVVMFKPSQLQMGAEKCNARGQSV